MTCCHFIRFSNRKCCASCSFIQANIFYQNLGEDLGRYADKKLRERGVEIRSKTRVGGVTRREVQLNDGTQLTSFTLIWTAGASPNPTIDLLDCPKERGRLKVNQFLSVETRPGVWAVGDCALVPDLTTGQFCPPTAQHAVREGKVLAHNILAEIRGTTKKPFKFKTLGQLASIGRRTGVAQILGLKFSGFLAWFLWRGIYWSKLPRMERKCASRSTGCSIFYLQKTSRSLFRSALR